jgi:hypothetical protein
MTNEPSVSALLAPSNAAASRVVDAMRERFKAIHLDLEHGYVALENISTDLHVQLLAYAQEARRLGELEIAAFVLDLQIGVLKT